MIPVLTKTIPKAAGVYYFKNKDGLIIYVGKAKSLHARVHSYFQKNTDWKVKSLLDEYHDLDYILTKNEMEAFLLEAQMVKEHQPKFNVLLRDGQPFLYILFTMKDPRPILTVVRNKTEKGTYFGPFMHKRQARAVARYLSETFRLNICNKKIENGCLDYHLGRCAGSCMKNFDNADYLFRLDLAMQVLKNNHQESQSAIQQKIKEYNAAMAFEKSKQLNDYLHNLEVIFETLKAKFTEDKYWTDIFVAATPVEHHFGADIAEQLGEFLNLDKPIKRIDCFDISHFQSSYLVGACVRFSNGKPDKNNFRRFKIRTLTEQNDYAALQEIISRRYRDEVFLPDLIVIDGGIGQLHAAQAVMREVPLIALAKREETLYGTPFPEGKKLDIHSPVSQLLIALRDYTHHFAISYHKLRRQKQLRD